MGARTASILVIATCQVAALALWFSAAAVLPLWLGRQLWRQSRSAADLARQVQQQARHLQQLGRDEELLRRAEQVAQLGSFDWNPVTGALHWSDEHFRIQGYRPGEVIPSFEAWLARVHPEDRDEAVQVLQAARSGRPLLLHSRTAQLAWWLTRLWPERYAAVMKRRLRADFLGTAPQKHKETSA